MRSSTAKVVLIAVLIGGRTALAFWATLPHRPRPEEGTAGPVSASAALRGDPAGNEGYARAHTPRPFRFPDDHGPHPEFRTEWWYFTGNLDGAEGRPFGYQLTFFRIAQSPKPVSPDSPWRANTLYMAHFTVSDIAEGAFHASACPRKGDLTGTDGIAPEHPALARTSPHSPYTHPKPGRGPPERALPTPSRTTQPAGPSDATVSVAKTH